MPISNINIGTIANDGTGDDLREAFIKVNNNFATLNAQLPESTTVVNRLADSSTVRGIFYQKVGAELQLRNLEAGSNITLTSNNDKITIAASGVISLGIVGNTGPLATLVNGNTLQVFGNGAAVAQILPGGAFPTLEIASFLSNENTPTLGANLLGAGFDIVNVDVIQSNNVQSLVYGIDVDDRNSFIGFDMGTITLDASIPPVANITNLLDLYFSVNPVDMGTILVPNTAVHDFGSI
jgi:hypothetical protein